MPVGPAFRPQDDGVLTTLHALRRQRWKKRLHLPDYERGQALWAAQLAAIPSRPCSFSLLGEAPPEAVWPRSCAILRAYRQQAIAGRIPDLVDGDWLQRHLGVGEGKETGRLLAALRREEIAGRVRSTAQASDFLIAHRRKNDQKTTKKTIDSRQVAPYNFASLRE